MLIFSLQMDPTASGSGIGGGGAGGSGGEDEVTIPRAAMNKVS